MIRISTKWPAHFLTLACVFTASMAAIDCSLAQTQTSTTQFLYDGDGNVIKRIDPRAQETSYSYDALNRLIQQVQPAPVVGGATPAIQTTHDGQDQLKTVVDPRNLTTTYTTTGLGDNTTLASPDTGSAVLTYDAAGNVKTRKDARNKTVTYTYDALNRLTKIDYPTGVDTLLEYDGGTAGGATNKGQLTKITDQAGITTFTYDAFGRLLTKTQTVSTLVRTLTQVWGTTGTAKGRLASVTYPSGNRLNYTYNAAGQITQISLNPTNANGVGTNTASTVILLSNIAYTPFGAPASWQWGNHTTAVPSTVTRSYDLDGRLTSYPLGHTAQSGVVRTLTWDAASRITAYTHVNGAGVAQTSLNQGFAYDNLDRLTGWTAGTSTQAYGYDATGNRTNLSIGASAYTYTTAASSNRLNSTTGPLPAKTNTYDAAGNLLTNGTATFTYSDRGRLASAKVGTNTVTYLVNALEQRLKKTGPTAIVPTGANYYAYDQQGQLIGEYNATNKVISETVYLGTTPVALIKQTIAGSTTTTAANYIYADQIDTPRVITRASDNKMQWRWDQADPFGLAPANENPQALGAFTSNARFPGQLYDKETNLHYNWHRDYDPQLGRYIQSDPIGLAGGINTFAYVEGNPLVSVDPDGQQRVPSSGRFSGFDPITPPGNCATGDCAAGLKPTRPELRSQAEVDRGQCRLVCNMTLTPPLAICNRVVAGGLLGTGAGGGGEVRGLQPRVQLGC